MQNAPTHGELTPRAARSWTPLSLGVLGVGVGFLVAAAILFGFQLSGRFDTIVYSTPDTGTAFNVSAILDAAGGQAPADPGGARIARVVIPAIEVDAPVVVKGIDPQGVMEVPSNGHDVAWYDFTAKPGTGGNAVFSAHVDFHDIGPAVFWDLGQLEEGDVIEVHLDDGSVHRYGVTGKAAFDADAAPVDQIVGQTENEAVTLITCTGRFSSVTRQYDQRLVVRAERVDGADGASARR